MSRTRRHWFGDAWAFLRSVVEKFIADSGFFLTSVLPFNLLLYLRIGGGCINSVESEK